MTDWRDLPAGLELDGLVADRTGLPDGAYSTDRLAALDLAEACRETGWGVMTLSCPDHPETEPDKQCLCALIADGHRYAEHAPTLPLAIVRAVMAALDHIEATGAR